MKKSFLLFLFCCFVSISYSQNTKYDYLGELSTNGDYAKCWKKSEKGIKKNRTEPIPYLFKAVALSYLPYDKKVLATYRDVEREWINALTKAKQYDKSNSSFTEYKSELAELQEKLLQKTVELYSQDELRKGDKIYKLLSKIFDDSSEPYKENYNVELQKLFFEKASQEYYEKEDVLTCLDFILKGKQYLKTEEVAKNYDDFLQTLQNKALHLGEALYRRGKEDEADKYFNRLHKVFNYPEVEYVFNLEKTRKANESRRFIDTMIFDTVYYSHSVWHNLFCSSFGYLEPEYYFKEYDNPKYRVAETAFFAEYLTDKEKAIIYLLNLIRMNPKLFSETYLQRFRDIYPLSANNTDFSELQEKLSKAEKAPPLPVRKKLTDITEKYVMHGMHRKKGRFSLNDQGIFAILQDGITMNHFQDKTPISIVIRILRTSNYANTILFDGYKAVGVAIRDHYEFPDNMETIGIIVVGGFGAATSVD